MKKAIKLITDFLGIIVPCCTFLVIFITFIYSIISRYIFRTPVTWSYEISVLGYMWTMFFGVGMALKNDEHVVFSLVYDVLNPKLQFLCKAIYNVALIILLAICLVPCYENLLKSTSVTGVLKIPYKVAFAPFLYMLVEVIIRSIFKLKDAYVEYQEKKAVPVKPKKEVNK